MKPTPEGQGVLPGIQSRLLVRGSDPGTSKAAARELVRSDRLTAQQNATYAILCKYGPGTAKEIALRFVHPTTLSGGAFVFSVSSWFVFYAAAWGPSTGRSCTELGP